MYRIYFLLLIFWFGFNIEASHFRGGTITWKPINNNVTNGSTVFIIITQTYSWTLSQIECNDSMIAAQSPDVNLGMKAGSGSSLLCNDSCSTSGGYVGHEVPIIGTCVDFSTALDLTVSQRSSLVNLTAGAHFIVTFGTSGGWQLLALGSAAGWSLSCTLDLRARSDNGLINTPPVATCISYISIPVNIQQTIQIPVLDADNDFLRCRFANGYSECANACPPTSLPSGTTLSTSCILTITGITAGDYYLVAIQVEDFLTNTSSIPLSSVPLQFLIYVYATPICTLKPLLIANIKNNDCQGVQVGVNFTITFTVINQCGSGRTILDIATLSFPILNKSPLIQNTTNSSLWSMKITWTPTLTQVGSLVFCAVAVDNASVQSDQYCMTFSVSLTSVPLCPGATVASTTMITSIQTSATITSTSITTQVTSMMSSFVVSTSSITSQQSTNVTIMNITSSSIIKTSSTSSVKPTAVINWPLIIGLSLLTLALILCCLLCCLYYFFGGLRRRRRHRKNVKESNYNFELDQIYKTSDQQFLTEHGRKQNYKQRSHSQTTMRNNSSTPSNITLVKFDRSEKSFIHDEEKLNNQRKYIRSTNSVREVEEPQSIMLNEISVDKRKEDLSIVEDAFASLIVPLSASMSSRIKTVTITKLPRSWQASVEAYEPRSAMSMKSQSIKSSHNDLNDSGNGRTDSKSASHVSVSRIRRSSSVDLVNHNNQRSTTTLSRNNLSRFTSRK